MKLTAYFDLHYAEACDWNLSAIIWLIRTYNSYLYTFTQHCVRKRLLLTLVSEDELVQQVDILTTSSQTHQYMNFATATLQPQIITSFVWLSPYGLSSHHCSQKSSTGLDHTRRVNHQPLHTWPQITTCACHLITGFNLVLVQAAESVIWLPNITYIAHDLFMCEISLVVDYFL